MFKYSSANFPMFNHNSARYGLSFVGIAVLLWWQEFPMNWCVDWILAFLAVLSLLGIGRFCLPKSLWDRQLMLGLGIVSTLQLFGSFWGIHWGLIWIILGGILFLKNKDDWTAQMHLQRSFPPIVLWILLGILGLVVWHSQCSIVDTDALYYHVSLPKHLWMGDSLVGGETRPNGSRPLIFHLFLSLMYGLGGSSTVVAFSSLLGWLSLLSIVQEIRRVDDEERGNFEFWALLLFISSYSFWEQLWVVNNNMITMFWVWLAFLERRSNRWQLFSTLMAFALISKYTSFGILLGIGLFSSYSWTEKWKIVGVIALWCAPWWLRNIFEGLHPLFPYAGWDIQMPFLYVEKYGMGRDLQSMLLLPWNILTHAQINHVQFFGRLSPLFGVLGFAWMIRNFQTRKNWDVAAILCLGWCFWALGPHWIRHLFPMMGVVVFAFATALSWNAFPWKMMGLTAVIVGIPHNILPILEEAQQDQTGAHQSAIAWFNKNTAAHDKIALLCVWNGLELDREYLFGSVEDHTPIRHWMLKYQMTAVQEMKKQGVKFVALGPYQWHPKAYPFIHPDDLKTQWIDPMNLLKTLLLKEGRFVVQIDGVEIYQLL